MVALTDIQYRNIIQHVDDLLPDEPIPPEAWAEPDPNEVITTRFHIDEWPVT